MTTEQDFGIRKVIRNEIPTVTLFNSITAEKVKVPAERASSMLSETTKRIKVVNGQAIKYGSEIKAFVLNKEDCGSVVSDDTKQIAFAGEVKRKRQNRGKRGKRRR